MLPLFVENARIFPTEFSNTNNIFNFKENIEKPLFETILPRILFWREHE